MINFIEESTNRTNGTLFSNDLNEEILDVFNFFISASNIRKYRYRMGYRFLKVKHAPLLTIEHQLMRLNWCLRNKDNPFLDLFYIFVDESKIELNYKKEKHIRRPKKHSACLIQNPKDRRIKLNIWVVLVLVVLLILYVLLIILMATKK